MPKIMKLKQIYTLVRLSKSSNYIHNTLFTLNIFSYYITKRVKILNIENARILIYIQ